MGGTSHGEDGLFAEDCLSPGRAGQVPSRCPKLSLQGLLLGLLCRSGVELGGLRLRKGDETPNPGLLDTGHSTTQTKAGLSPHCALKPTCRKLASGASLLHRPTQMLSEGLTTGPKFLLKHIDPSQAALLHKGRCLPGQLTQAAVRGGSLLHSSSFFPSKGRGPSLSPTQTWTLPDALPFPPWSWKEELVAAAWATCPAQGLCSPFLSLGSAERFGWGPR